MLPPDGVQFYEMRSGPLTDSDLFMTVISRTEIFIAAGLSRIGSKKNDAMGTGIHRTITPSQKHQWRQLGVHNYIKILIIAGLFCFLFRNEIEGIVNRWLADSSWSHGFLIPLFSLYFVNQKREEILNLRSRPNYLGLVFLIFGILFYPFNIVHLQYGYLSSIDMIATLGAIVLFLGGWKLVKYTWLPIAFLFFAHKATIK